MILYTFNNIQDNFNKNITLYNKLINKHNINQNKKQPMICIKVDKIKD